MNLELHVVSLVLASTTGWMLLVFGALPVPVLRRHPREPLVAAGGWAIVSATAPPEVFHWYLIFAIFCLVAFTKLYRPAGKIWLAITAALGLSLGIVFPLEALPPLLAREYPYMLATLYLGGAATGLAYAVAVTGVRGPVESWRPTRLAKGLLIVVIGWNALLGARPWLAARLVSVPPLTDSSPGTAALPALLDTIVGLGLVLLILALLIVVLARRPPPAQRGFAGIITALLALAENALTQLFYR
jgi:hypothetical protein